MTFKMNWEKSEEKHELPTDLAEKMLTISYPNKKIQSLKLIAGGCANLNIKVDFEGSQDPIILRIYLRDKDAAFREQKIGNLLKDNIPVPEIYYIGNIDNYCFSIAKFMPGIPLRNLLLGTEVYNLEDIMMQVGALLTKISSYKFTESGFLNRDLEVVEKLGNDSLKQFIYSCLEHKKIEKYLGADMSVKIRYLVDLIPNVNDKNINLVHADFDPANILVSYVDGKWKVSAILDWEFAYSGSWLNDVANILRYSHKMPPKFQNSFLKGLEDSGLKLPENWQVIIHQYNLSSLLDSMIRHPLESCPNIKEDICDLIKNIVVELGKLLSK